MVGAPNGEELLPLVRAALGIGQRREGSVADWFLSGFERGNGATRLRAWTEGNAVRSLVHGRTYYKALARALAAASDGDSVQFVGWRGDADELLAEGGPTVVEALSGAASRGASVRGLLWHACGAGSRKGRLAPGFDADSLAVTGDPTTDVQALLDVRAVFRAGRRV